MPAFFDQPVADRQPPAFLIAEARHEAAHAVVALVLRIELEFVTLNPPPASGNPFTRTRGVKPSLADAETIRHYTIQVMAGNAADVVFGRSTGTTVRSGRSPQDRADARKFFRPTFHGETLEDVWVSTIELVREHRDSIALVADALLAAQDGTLTGAQVRDLLSDG